MISISPGIKEIRSAHGWICAFYDPTDSFPLRPTFYVYFLGTFLYKINSFIGYNETFTVVSMNWKNILDRIKLTDELRLSMKVSQGVEAWDMKNLMG